MDTMAWNLGPDVGNTESSVPQKKLLFLSPCMPCADGGGPAQRAYHTLRALSMDYAVYLLAVGFKDRRLRCVPSPPGSLAASAYIPVNPWTRPNLLARMAIGRLFPGAFHRLHAAPSEWACAAPGLVREAASAFAAIQFDRLHLFRFYMEPFATPYRAASPEARVQVDLDEVESLTRFRLAELHELNDERRPARNWRRDARAYERAEAASLPRYDRLFVSSSVEKERLESKLPGLPVHVAPNIVDVAPPARLPQPETGPFVFLFVGGLAYYPNSDAVTWFAEHVLPVLRRQTDDVRFDVVGTRASRADIARWKKIPGLRYWGPVTDLGAHYATAGAAVVPLRAGGGTRIKILEAFAHRLPVISTAVGAEGIEAADGEHLLIADDPGEFTAACERLRSSPVLAGSLAANALGLQRRGYAPPALRRVLRENGVEEDPEQG